MLVSDKFSVWRCWAPHSETESNATTWQQVVAVVAMLLFFAQLFAPIWLNDCVSPGLFLFHYSTLLSPPDWGSVWKSSLFFLKFLVGFDVCLFDTDFPFILSTLSLVLEPRSDCSATWSRIKLNLWSRRERRKRSSMSQLAYWRSNLLHTYTRPEVND